MEEFIHNNVQEQENSESETHKVLIVAGLYTKRIPTRWDRSAVA